MKYFYILCASLVLISLSLTACAKAESVKSSASEKPQVLATIGMIWDAAQAIGGDLFQSEALMGAGVDPHTYRASARDIDRLSKATLVLYSGLHLEAKLGEVFENMQGAVKVRAVSESIPRAKLIEVQKGQYDPHVWFDVSLWLHSVADIYQTLKELVPDQAEVLQVRYETYVASLRALDVDIRQKLAAVPVENRILVTAHDAFEYFGRAYGFEVRGLQGMSTVSEAGSRDMIQLADYITKKKIPAIFVESSVPRKNIEALQAAVRSRGFDVKIGGQLFSDAMGDEGTFAGSYVGMLTHNAETIANALSAGIGVQKQ